MLFVDFCLSGLQLLLLLLLFDSQQIIFFLDEPYFHEEQLGGTGLLFFICSFYKYLLSIYVWVQSISL